MRRLLLAMILTLLLPTLASAQGWYFEVISPVDSTVANVGPYNSLNGCNDWQGSACYLHPAACSSDPTPYNCRIIGNGFAYPASWAYPPTFTITPCGACYQLANAPAGSVTKDAPQGRYGLVYPDGGGVDLKGCNTYKAATDLKGSRCFFVGDTGE